MLREVAGRLRAMRVSLSTTRQLVLRAFGVAIAFAAPLAASAQRGEYPRPAVDLTPGTANYKVRLEAAGQVVMMDLIRTTKAVNGTWVVTETSGTPGHQQMDESTVEKKTLIIRKRVFRAEGGVADLQFAGHTVTGTIDADGQKQTINRDIGTVIFADGAAGQDVLAALPLAKGYNVEFRNFNVGSLQVKTLQLRVMDTERVTVPAGTFDTWKVLITSLDGGSDTYGLFVDKRTHRVVKMAMSVPNLGDALAIAELVK